MGGYKLALGFAAIIISALLWIPLNYAVELLIPLINSGITDAAVIQNNNSVAYAFYYGLFFVILAVVLYVIKTSKGEEEDDNNGGYYVPDV